MKKIELEKIVNSKVNTSSYIEKISKEKNKEEKILQLFFHVISNKKKVEFRTFQIMEELFKNNLGHIMCFDNFINNKEFDYKTYKNFYFSLNQLNQEDPNSVCDFNRGLSRFLKTRQDTFDVISNQIEYIIYCLKDEKNKHILTENGDFFYELFENFCNLIASDTINTSIFSYSLDFLSEIYKSDEKKYKDLKPLIDLYDWDKETEEKKERFFEKTKELNISSMNEIINLIDNRTLSKMFEKKMNYVNLSETIFNRLEKVIDDLNIYAIKEINKIILKEDFNFFENREMIEKTAILFAKNLHARNIFSPIKKQTIGIFEVDDGKILTEPGKIFFRKNSSWFKKEFEYRYLERSDGDFPEKTVYFFGDNDIKIDNKHLEESKKLFIATLKKYFFEEYNLNPYLRKAYKEQINHINKKNKLFMTFFIELKKNLDFYRENFVLKKITRNKKINAENKNKKTIRF